MFKIAKYGYDVVIVISIITITVIIASFFIRNLYIRVFIDLFFTVFFLFTLYFFRDPERNSPNGENLIICPADGEICLITEVENDKYFGGKSLQVSIFMSPLNVHVNRIPMDGKVTFKKYLPGKFHLAYIDKASEENEQTIVVIENNKNKLAMKQIAGYIARRIVNSLEVGDKVTQGDRFGMIKFGSRVDVLVSPSTKVNIKVGDKVSAGETILGYFN